ncbi:MAG: PAS domain-containing protein, partial [Anaerolineales bacterium]|nr:PAS domain-containing protein [Anaerolineales bacterium]
MTNQPSSDDHMQNRINNIFSGEDMPAHASLKEFEAMKSRIQELEEQIKQKEAEAVRIAEEALKNKKATQVFESTSSSKGQPDSASVKSDSWLTKFWNLVVGAHPSITNTREQNSARLAASFLFVILLLEFVGGIVRSLQTGVADAFSGTFLLAILATSVSYILSRTKWLRVAIFLFAMFFSSIAYFTIASQGTGADISSVMLVYVPLSLVVASAFLSSWAVFLLIGINVFAYYVTIQSTFIIPPENFGVQAGIITTIGMVLILLTNFRKRSEEQSLQEIKSVNDELQLANTELIGSREELEIRVQDRTHDLELASEVGRIVTAKVDNLYELLAEAVEQIRENFNLYYTQVYLTDRSGRTITLRAGTGDVGKQLLQRGHQLIVSSDSLNGRAALEKQAMIVADTSNSRTFLPNPLLPKTRSEMAVPLLLGNQVVGVLDMQSEHPNALNESNLPAFEALAGQLAVAIQNASLFEQANQARAEVVEQAKRLSLASWDSFLNAVERSDKLGYVYNQNEVLPFVAPTEESINDNSLETPIYVAGAEIGKIQVVDNPERQWTPAESQFIQDTAAQLATHIENLRLLAQSEKYRAEAEQVSKRLTREAWNEYFITRNDVTEGFIYDENQVVPLNQYMNGTDKPVQSHPLYVRDEHIGELSIEQPEDGDTDIVEIMSAVSQQLSNHIENLRLLEQAELSRVEVKKGQERFELAVRGSDDGVWDWDIANDTIYYSPRWKSMLGYEEHELTRGFVEWEELIHPDDREYATTALDKYLAQETDDYDVELRLRHKNGSWVWIRDRGKAIRDKDGTAYRMAGAHTDITQRKLYEQLIADRANQLETVATVSTTASTVLNPDALLQQVVNLTKSRFNLYHAHIYLLDENWSTLLLAAGAGEVGAQMSESGHAI